MRSVDPDPQAGPLRTREDDEPSTHALVSRQQDQCKGVPQIPLHLRTRQHNTLDLSPITLWEVEFQLAAAFLVIFIFDIDRKLNMVELSMARSKVVGQVVRTDNDRFMFRLAQGNLLRANTVWTVAEIDMSSNSLLQSCTFSSCGFFLNRFRFQTDATGCDRWHLTVRTHAHSFLVACHTSHNSLAQGIWAILCVFVKSHPIGCIGGSSESTPINLPTNNSAFQLERDATIAASEDLDLPRHSTAPSGSKLSSHLDKLQKTGCGLRLCCKSDWLQETGCGRGSRNNCSKCSRICFGIRETCATQDREFCCFHSS